MQEHTSFWNIGWWGNMSLTTVCGHILTFYIFFPFKNPRLQWNKMGETLTFILESFVACWVNLHFFISPLSTADSPLAFCAAPKLHLICTIPINRFQISCGYFEHEHGGQGSAAAAHTGAQAHRHLVSIHSSFDNKNTSLELSGEHKTERKGRGD